MITDKGTVESEGSDQKERGEILLDAPAGRFMTDYDTVEAKRNNQEEQEEIPLADKGTVGPER